MSKQQISGIADVVGNIPNRMAFAGGWIDQPFVSKLNPSPPGSMVVVALEPTFRVMDRCGMATSTRKIATRLWGGSLPPGDRMELVKLLYEEENRDLPEPSGSQDMIGLIYPGVSRIDYDYQHEGGYFPVHVESNTDPAVALWLERVVYVVPIAQRPDGYNPLEVKNLDAPWIERLSNSGKNCFDSIVNKDAKALGAAMNECMLCWETLLPCVLHHRTLTVNLKEILSVYQNQYHGAMYSGCGGGYIYVVSDSPVPGGFTIEVRVE